MRASWGRHCDVLRKVLMLFWHLAKPCCRSSVPIGSGLFLKQIMPHNKDCSGMVWETWQRVACDFLRSQSNQASSRFAGQTSKLKEQFLLPWSCGVQDRSELIWWKEGDLHNMLWLIGIYSRSQEIMEYDFGDTSDVSSKQYQDFFLGLTS